VKPSIFGSCEPLRNVSHKNKQAYRNVYIDNDLPVETRMFQGNVRTLLKEIGKANEMMFVGNKLVHKRH
jgi:hypothetical protein